MIECVKIAFEELRKAKQREDFSSENLMRSMKDICEHVRGFIPKKKLEKNYSIDYVASVCFSKKRVMTRSEADSYCVVTLIVALNQLGDLLEEVELQITEGGDEAVINTAGYFYNYLFDLQPFVEYWAKKSNPAYRFFEGGKSSANPTEDLYLLSRALGTVCITRAENPLYGNFRECSMASVVILRQALEAKYERAVGVALFDSKGNSPKYRHGFHYGFIKEYQGFFFDGFSINAIDKVYDWCSTIVHGGDVPKVWLVPQAHNICSGVFGSGSDGKNGFWSMFGGIRVDDIYKMQSAYIKYFFKNYDHGIYCISSYAPECVEHKKYLVEG